MTMVMGLLVAFKIPCPPGVLAVGVELVVAGIMELVIASKIPCPAVVVATPKLARVMGVVVKDTTLDKSAGVASTALGITPM